MNDADKAGMGGLIVGLVLGGVVTCMVYDSTASAWTIEAIEHGAGRYNATTGEFEWIPDE